MLPANSSYPPNAILRMDSDSDGEDDDTSLGSYEANMKAQMNGEYPAKTHSQAKHHRRTEKRLVAFLDGHNIGHDGSAWIQEYGNDAHGAMLGDFWVWCQNDCKGSGFQTLSMNTLETGDSKEASMVIRKRFPSFLKQSHKVERLRVQSSEFEQRYGMLSRALGGSKSGVIHTTPMFEVDARRLIESTEPTVMGIRMNAFLVVWSDLGVSVDQM